MFEETNQTMEGFESEALPENLFDDDEEATESSPSSEERALPEGETVEKGESGSDSGEAQGAEGERAPTKPALWEEGETADKAKLLANSKNEPTGESRRGGNHAEGSTSDGSVLRVKYNGEERDLSLDEARTLAQKGLNYDHVAQERDRNRNAFDFLMERAKVEGITVEQLIERERGQAENQRLEAKISEIRARDDDASEETVKSLAMLELEAERAREERERAAALEEKNKAEIEGWSRLFREHPELIAADGGAKVSQGVFDLVKAGHSPVEAFYIERSRELEAQNRMISSANEAKKKSIGSLAGVQNAEEDDFLAGFDGES